MLAELAGALPGIPGAPELPLGFGEGRGGLELHEVS